MRIIFVSIIFLLVICLASQAQISLDEEFEALEPQGKTNLLLLGTRENGSYFTYVISHKGDNPQLEAKLPYLVSPQPKGFYYLKNKYYSYYFKEDQCRQKERNYNRLVISKNLSRLLDTFESIKKPGPDTPYNLRANCDVIDSRVDFLKKSPRYYNTLDLNYLISGMASFQGSSNVVGEPGYPYNFTIPFPDIPYLELYQEGGYDFKKPEISKVSSKAIDAMKPYQFDLPFSNPEVIQYNEHEHKSGNFKIPSQYLFPQSQPSDSSRFKITRHGDSMALKWSEKRKGFIFYKNYMRDYVGRINFKPLLYHELGQVKRTIKIMASIGTGPKINPAVINCGPLPAQVRPYNSLPFTLKQSAIDSMQTTGDDFFLSPTEDVLYYQKLKSRYSDKSTLQAYNSQGRKKDFKLTLKTDNIIMAEWATGKYVEKWLDELLFR